MPRRRNTSDSLPNYPELKPFRERFSALPAVQQAELLRLAERLRPYHEDGARRDPEWCGVISRLAALGEGQHPPIALGGKALDRIRKQRDEAAASPRANATGDELITLMEQERPRCEAAARRLTEIAGRLGKASKQEVGGTVWELAESLLDWVDALPNWGTAEVAWALAEDWPKYRDEDAVVKEWLVIGAQHAQSFRRRNEPRPSAALAREMGEAVGELPPESLGETLAAAVRRGMALVGYESPTESAKPTESAGDRLHQHHMKMFVDAAARSLGLKMPGEDIPPPQQDQKRRRVPKEEAEVIVRDYLKAHKARADKAEVSVRELRQETGLAVASIQVTAVWRAYQDRLDTLGLSKRPRRKQAQALPSNANATIGEDDAELQRLMQEQTADDQEWAAGRGRRGKVRVRKKI